MYHYLFTNDIRISKLEEQLIIAGHDFINDCVSSDKSENNNMMTLSSYFNITKNSMCAKLCASSNVKAVVLNYIKKFQFPNPRTKESLKLAHDDGILLAPLRIVLQVLYLMRFVCPDEAYLSRSEIRDFIFYNSAVAKNTRYDVVSLIGQIISFRKKQNFPETIELDNFKRVWNQEERQLREMTKILIWAGCVAEDCNSRLFIKYDILSVENKAALIDILNCNEYWTPDYNKPFEELKLDYQQYMDVNDQDFNDLLVDANEELSEENRIKGGTNIILYGVPGAGKSWTIKHEYCEDDTCMERLVFHPDYTYSDFVGQILPKVSDDGSVSYEFSPGPFTKLVRKAYINPDRMFYLIIEEVNRGNAPAIFGDVFQLLDRNQEGGSEYEITNADIAKIVYSNENHKVSIPSNMSILCTMNTSDQNVFTLDTAFQRRWSMRLIKNKFHMEDSEEKNFAERKILDSDLTWGKFFREINEIILSKNIRMTSSEDKRLGTHFVAKEDLIYKAGDERQNSRFAEKVLKYLWDDAFKFTKEDIFNLDAVKSLEEVIEMFVAKEKNERFHIFKDNIYNALFPMDTIV